MGARLLCRTGELSGKTYSLTAETIIGRGDGSHFVISSDLISGRHACIRQDGKGFVLEDLGSANGTWVDGERVVQPVRLDRLNVISLARKFDLIFQAEAAVPATAPKGARPTAAAPVASPVASPPIAKPPIAPPPIVKPTSAPPPIVSRPIEPPLAPPPEKASPGPGAMNTQIFSDGFEALPPLERDQPPVVRGETLEVGGITRGVPASPADAAKFGGGSTMHMDGPFELPPLESVAPTAAPALYYLEVSGLGMRTQTVELVKARRYTLGRAMDCDIPLDEEQVSRYHATVTVGDVVLVEDAGSSNGTHMDGRRLSAPAVLVPGSTFTLGPNISVTLISR